MFGLCVALGLSGVGAYLSESDHLIGGMNLAINIVNLLILPILQATQNRDGAASRTSDQADMKLLTSSSLTCFPDPPS